MSKKHLTLSGVNFTNILCVAVGYKSVLLSFPLVTVWFCKFLVQKLIKKCRWNWLLGSISSTLNARIFCTIFFCQSQNVNRKSCQNAIRTKKFVRKNVDEIDTWGLLHQHFTCAFFIRKSFEQIISAKSLALNELLYKKCVC